MRLCWTLLFSIIVTLVKLTKSSDPEFHRFYPASFKMDGAKKIYDKCISENPEANLSTIYTDNIRLQLLTEPTKCYIECILNSNQFVNNSLQMI